MFIQVVRGKVKDADAVRALDERWERELAPGAQGFLGSTSGVTDEGTHLAIVRFESQEAARRNSDRPEQGALWNEMSKLIDGDATFYDCPDVDAGLGGGSDDAGFVQVMISRVSDVAKAKEFGAKYAELASTVRPDLLGYTDAYSTDGMCITTSYFTSEADAREGEKKEMPAEHQAVFEGFRDVISDTEYFDLRKPWFFSP